MASAYYEVKISGRHIESIAPWSVDEIEQLVRDAGRERQRDVAVSDIVRVLPEHREESTGNGEPKIQDYRRITPDYAQ